MKKRTTRHDWSLNLARIQAAIKSGKTVAEACKEVGASPSNYYVMNKKIKVNVAKDVPGTPVEVPNKEIVHHFLDGLRAGMSDSKNDRDQVFLMVGTRKNIKAMITELL